MLSIVAFRVLGIVGVRVYKGGGGVRVYRGLSRVGSRVLGIMGVRVHKGG